MVRRLSTSIVTRPWSLSTTTRPWSKRSGLRNGTVED